MKKHFRFLTLILSYGVLAVGFMPKHLWSLDITAAPVVGMALPVGNSADNWRPGWSVGLELTCPYNSRLDMGVRSGLQKWKPDAPGMLRLNNQKMHLEDNKGWLITGDISGLARYRAYGLRDSRISVWMTGALGAAYERSADVLIRGYYTAGETAINRYIFHPARTKIAPTASAGVSIMWADLFEPSVRYQKVFTSGGSASLVLSLRLMKR